MMEIVDQGRVPALPAARTGRFVTWAAATTAPAAAVALAIGVLTPPHGGVLCVQARETRGPEP
jgi:hypothetical protein